MIGNLQTPRAVRTLTAPFVFPLVAFFTVPNVEMYLNDSEKPIEVILFTLITSEVI